MLKKIKENKKMSKKASISAGDQGKTGNPDFKGFVNYSLTEAEKKDSAKFLEDFDVTLWTERSIENGYKFSLSLDSRQGSFLCSMSTKSGENAGFILTARGKSVTIALGRVLYLHTVIFDAGTWSRDRGFDDDQW